MAVRRVGPRYPLHDPVLLRCRCGGVASDSIMIVKDCVKSSKVVAGGGAVEMEISRTLKE